MSFGVDGIVSVNTGAMVDALVSVYPSAEGARAGHRLGREEEAAVSGVMSRLDDLDDAIKNFEDEDDLRSTRRTTKRQMPSR